MLYKDLGLIAQVLDERRLPSLRGHLAIAHCRYSTTGSTIWENAQPTFRLGHGRSIAIGHNGNLVNTRELLSHLEGGKTRLPATTDTELLTALLADDPSDDTVEALKRVLPTVRGAYSLAILDEKRVIGVRDPFGFRPLVLGRLEPEPGDPEGERSGGWVISSEIGGHRSRRRNGRPRHRAGRDRGPRAGQGAGLGPLRRRPRTALRLRADLLRPARFLHAGPQPLRVAAPDGRCSCSRSPGRSRPRDAGPGHGRAGGGRVRGRLRPAVPRGHGPKSLQRPHLHPALAGDAFSAA